MLTDRNGSKVEIGDVLIYNRSPERVYRVVEMLGTFTRWGIAFGDRVGRPSERHIVIRPRLMRKES